MRQHFVTFTCDRCGKKEDRSGKSDMNPPPGWSRADGLDLCPEDMREWQKAFNTLRRVFRLQLSVGEIFQPSVVQSMTKIDDELEELDPETHPEDHDA